MSRTGELQLDRPDDFLRAERVFQRIGVVLLTLFVIAGAAGAFGSGPLSTITTRAGGTAITYERFGRTTAPTSIAIDVQSTAGDGEPVRFHLDRMFVRDLAFLEVRPSDALKGFDDQRAVFEVHAAGGAGHVELHFKPSRPGVFETAVVPEQGETAHLWQFIYY